MRRLALSILTVLFQACSQHGMQFDSTGPTTATAKSPTCSVTTTAAPLRIIFMVDNSGSTADTDPNQYYRNATIQNFLTHAASHSNLTYGFGFFAGTDAYFYDTSTQNFSLNAIQPFGTAMNLTSALNLFSTLPAGDATPLSGRHFRHPVGHCARSGPRSCQLRF